MSTKTVRFVAVPLLRSVRTGSSHRHRWHALTPLLIAVSLLFVSVSQLFGGAGQTRAAQGNDPAAVVEAYVAAVNARDLEGILALYADDAVHVALPTPDGSAGICLGKEQFRLWHTQSVANGDQIEVVDGTLAIDGDRVTFLSRIASDPWRELGLDTLEANTEAVVVDGRITTHVVMLTPSSVRELMAALGTIPAASPQVVIPHGVHHGNAR